MSSDEYLIKELIKIVKNKNTTESVKIKSLECLFLLIDNKSNEVKSNEVKSNEVKSNEVKSNEVKSNEVKSNEVKSNEVKSNEIKSNEIKSNEIKSNEVKSKSGFMSELQEKLKSRKDKT
jgi:hypothetical protein